MADLNISDLNSALGSYYRTNKKDIMAKLYKQEDARKIFNVVSGVQDEYVMTEIEAAEMMQAYQPNWTPKGEVKFQPEIIKVRPVKVDFPFTPKALEASWIGYLKTNGSSPTEYPFVKFIYEKLVERLVRDLNSVTINGVYVAPTTDVAGAARNAFDGLLQVKNKAILAGKITPIATGALTLANIVESVEKMIDGVDAEFRGDDLVILMSEAWRTAYFRKRRDPSFSNYGQASIDDAVIDFTNCKIVCPRYMNASNSLIITKPTNLLMAEDGVNEEENMIVQANRRMLEVMIDFKRGVGFGIADGYVWANDQDVAVLTS